jgi:hypothetical protein
MSKQFDGYINNMLVVDESHNLIPFIRSGTVMTIHIPIWEPQFIKKYKDEMRNLDGKSEIEFDDPIHCFLGANIKEQGVVCDTIHELCFPHFPENLLTEDTEKDIVNLGKMHNIFLLHLQHLTKKHNNNSEFI